VTIAQALAHGDRVYFDSRRAALTRLLCAPGEPDLDAIDATIEEFDSEWAATRAKIVATLRTREQGAATDRAQKSAGHDAGAKGRATRA